MSDHLLASPLDLNAYFARTGYCGPREASLKALNGIVAAHVQSIPFENLDVLMGRHIALDVAAVQQKLILQGRGGYCFEQNGLLLAVLQAVGFKVQPISARVRIGRPRDMVPPRTHLFVRLEIEGEPWLADVGVGGLSPTAALRLVLDVEQPTLHEPRRIIHEGGVYFHQAKLGGEWTDVCEFTLEEMPPIDREVANWYTCAHPQSHFRDRLMVARAAPDGVRLTVLNQEFSVRNAEGVATKRELASKGELLEVLSTWFGIHLPPEARLEVPALPWLN